MRSVVVAPPIPAHVASTPVPVADTVGTVHVPRTAVNVPPEETYPDQFRDVAATVVGEVVGLGLDAGVLEGGVLEVGMFVLGCMSLLIFQAPLTRTTV